MSAAAAADAADAAPKKSKAKLFILIGVVVVVLLGVGGGVMYYLKAKHAAEEAAAAEEEGDGGHAPSKKRAKKGGAHAEPPVFVPLDNFVVNLADRDADRYAQIGLALQVSDAKTGDSLKGFMPAIRNNILLLLSRKTSQDIASAEGKEKLAKELRAEALKGMGIDADDKEPAPDEDGKGGWPIRSVQFSSFIIQ